MDLPGRISVGDEVSTGRRPGSERLESFSHALQRHPTEKTSLKTLRSGRYDLPRVGVCPELLLSFLALRATSLTFIEVLSGGCR